MKNKIRIIIFFLTIIGAGLLIHKVGSQRVLAVVAPPMYCCGSWVPECAEWKYVCWPGSCDWLCVRGGYDCTKWCPSDTGGGVENPPGGGGGAGCTGACSAGSACPGGCVCCDWEEGVPNSGSCSAPAVCTCFTGETEVGMSNQESETKQIKDLRVGDEVGCYDKEGREKTCGVTKIYSRQSDHYYLLETALGRKVKTTQEHPFLSVSLQEAIERQGPSFERASFVLVKDLSVGDWVFVKGADDLVAEQVTKLERHNEPVEVYNLSVDGEETFFANDFAVHNKRGGAEPPTCKIAISQQIVADGKMATYNPNNASHEDDGLEPKLVTYSGKQLFEMELIPFEMGNPIVVGDPEPVCYFGFSNQVGDTYGSGVRSCDGNPINQPPFSKNLDGQNAGYACKGTGYATNWYLHPLSASRNWGCPVWGATGQDFWRQLGGNFLWLYDGAHVAINPPTNHHLVYKISFNYSNLSKDYSYSQIVFARHWRQSGGKTYYFPLDDGTINSGSGSKTVWLGPASDSLHIISEGATVLLSDIQVTFINISSAIGTEDNKVTIVNNSYGKASGWPSQGIGSVWLRNSTSDPWTQVVNAYDDWLAGRSDYTRMGYEWNLGSMSGTGERSRTVYAMVEGMMYNVGYTSQCSDTTNFTPAPPLTGTITGKVYNDEGNEDCRETTKVDGWSVTCKVEGGNDIPAQKTDTSFNCVNAAGEPELDYGWYEVKLTPPEGWTKTGCVAAWTGEGSYTQDVWIGEDSEDVLTFPMFLWQGSQKWFQTKGGDVHAEGGITSLIPLLAADGPFFSLRVNDAEKTAGVVTSGGSRDFAVGVDSTGFVSVDGWQGDEDSALFEGGSGKYNFAYYKSLLSGETTPLVKREVKSFLAKIWQRIKSIFSFKIGKEQVLAVACTTDCNCGPTYRCSGTIHQCVVGTNTCVVNCNEACTGKVCNTGLQCIGEVCRNSACPEETSCVCPTATPTPEPTPEPTPSPTPEPTPTPAPTESPAEQKDENIVERAATVPEEGGFYSYGDGNDTLIINCGGTCTIAPSSPGKKLVYLVDGDLQIDNNIVVEPTCSLVYIVSGNVTIDETVAQVDGVYIADGTISTGTVGGDTADAQLFLNGTFVGYDGFALQRDLKEGNTTLPAHVFTYRPDFIINAPEGMFTQSFTWKQVAPEGNP